MTNSDRLVEVVARAIDPNEYLATLLRYERARAAIEAYEQARAALSGSPEG